MEEQKKTRIWFWAQAMGEIMVVSIFSYLLRRFLFGGTSSVGDMIWYIMILIAFRHRWEKRLLIDVSRGWCFYVYSFIGTICLGIGRWFGERFYDCPPIFRDLALMLISIFVVFIVLSWSSYYG